MSVASPRGLRPQYYRLSVPEFVYINTYPMIVPVTLICVTYDTQPAGLRFSVTMGSDSVLHDRSRWRDLGVYEALLTTHKGAINAPGNEDDRTPLHLAAADGELAVVRLLLKHGAAVDALDEFGRTPLHAAAFAGQLDVVRELLERGAQADAVDADGITPTHLAATKNSVGVITELLGRGASLDRPSAAGYTPLKYAASWGHLELVKALAARGANVGSLKEGQSTPLQVAAMYEFPKVVSYLADLGADLEATGENKWTAVHYAAKEGSMKALNELVRRGAKVDPVAEDHSTPLHHAIHNDKLEVVKFLLDHGADMHIQNGKMATPVLVAASQNKLEILEEFLNRGGSTGADPRDHRTPLSAAVVGGHVEMVDALLLRGVPVNTTHWAGQTLLHLAARTGHLGIVKKLVDRGADPSIIDNGGDRPVDCTDDDDIMRLLLETEDGVKITDAYRRTDNTAVRKAVTSVFAEVSGNNDTVVGDTVAKMVSNEVFMYRLLKLTNGVEPRDDMPPPERAEADRIFKRAVIRALKDAWPEVEAEYRLAEALSRAGISQAETQKGDKSPTGQAEDPGARDFSEAEMAELKKLTKATLTLMIDDAQGEHAAQMDSTVDEILAHDNFLQRVARGLAGVKLMDEMKEQDRALVHGLLLSLIMRD